MKKLFTATGRTAYKLLAVILFFALWEAASRLRLGINPIFVPPFSKIISTLWTEVILTGKIWKHLTISLQRSLIGFCIGVAAAVPLGLAIGWFKRFGDFLNSLLQMFRNTPTLALLPVFIALFGIGETSKIVIIFWGVLWSVLLNTIAGVRAVDPQRVRASRSMGTRPLRLFGTVILPASLPYIFTGMRMAATTSILIIIAAEMNGANKGLGYQLYFYQVNMKYPEMYAYIVLLSLLGIGLNAILEHVERRSFRWRDETGTAK
ncbi:MAG: ABC transporter permease [Oscillospiraceae bacterium]|jgi:NitT/TauT family transport system permease protein|nr:ABC transporter permease [Oscillospiraceae bacterium]